MLYWNRVKTAKIYSLLAILVAAFFLFLQKNTLHIFGKGNLPMNEAELEGRVYAPDFPEGLEWLNTDQPI